MSTEIYLHSGIAQEDRFKSFRHVSEGEAEILYVKRGGGILILGDRVLPIRPHSLYFIAPGTLHCIAPHRCEEYEGSTIRLSREVFSSLLTLAGYEALFQGLLSIAAVTLDPKGALEAEALLSLFGEDELRHRVRALILLLELAAERKEGGLASHSKVAAITDYIREHLSEPVSLDEMSAELFISKYYMCHLFKSTTGISITAYILLQRVALAKRLLVKTALPVSEIATRAGFSDVTYFSRVFRKYGGQSASEYRRKNRI